MVQAYAAMAEGQARAEMDPGGGAEDELSPVKGRVKWFDATRGFGSFASMVAEAFPKARSSNACR